VTRAPDGLTGTRYGIYDPLFDTPSEDLYEKYGELRERYPVYYNPARHVWCLSRFEAVREAAGDWRTFSNASGVDLDVPARFLGEGDFLDNDPPKHDTLRAVTKARFTPRNVKQLEEVIERRVVELLARFGDRDEVDLAADFAWQLPIWVTCKLLGIPDADYEYVQTQMNALNMRTAGNAEAVAEVLSARDELQRYFASCADAKRGDPGDDLLTDLARAVDAGGLDADDLVGIALMMFVGGSETTSSLVANGLWLLDSFPEQQRILRTGQVAVEDAVEEMVRYDPPIQHLARTTMTDVTIDGVEIPRDARVVLLYGSANRDDRRFERAHEFDLTRVDKRHLGFGTGIHFCLGAPLARLEARIMLSCFFERVAKYEPSAQPERLASHNVRGITSLPARVTMVTS
jgi:cytochrome P450